MRDGRLLCPASAAYRISTTSWDSNWDPIPPWLKFDEQQLKRFAEMELQFQAKYQELEMAKLKEFGKIADI